MGCLTVLVSINHIYGKLFIFHYVFIIPLAKGPVNKIKTCQAKTSQHKGLGYGNSHNHKHYGKKYHGLF